ncbi:hypothetical protein I8H83_03850 [Candidatus Saccharibacteria bacterium]|nr:hypothetical protein [Candidatus Saccharibacteria bacterium]
MKERASPLNPAINENGTYRLTNVETFVIDDPFDARNTWNPDIVADFEAPATDTSATREMGAAAMKIHDTAPSEQEGRHDNDGEHITPIAEFGDASDIDGDTTSTIESPEAVDETEDVPVYEELVRKLENLRPMYGDIYRTALAQFPEIETLKGLRQFKTNESSESSSGGWKDESTGAVYPQIIMGEGRVLDIQKRRWAARLGLDAEWSQEEISRAPDDFWRLYTFAHEVGHAIQWDKNFESVFGPIERIEGSEDLAYRDYKKYVNSDAETNADYIAMLLVSHSEVGKSFKAPGPSHAPYEWRKWVKEL